MYFASDYCKNIVVKELNTHKIDGKTSCLSKQEDSRCVKI